MKKLEIMNTLSHPTVLWSDFTTSVSSIAKNVKKKSISFFERSNEDNERNESTLLGPHEALQRSYGSVNIELYEPDNLNLSEKTSYELETQRLLGDAPSLYPIISAETDFTSMTKRKNQLTIPIINIPPPEQDFNFLTVEIPNSNGGRISPGRSSGFHSGLSSPTPTTSSSFDFKNLDEEKFSWGRVIKIGILVTFFIIIAVVITKTSENHISYRQIAISQSKPYEVPLMVNPVLLKFYPVFTIYLKGAFVPAKYGNLSSNVLIVDIQRKKSNGKLVKANGESWEIPIFSPENMGHVPETTLSHSFNIGQNKWRSNDSYSLILRTNTEDIFPVLASARLLSEGVKLGAFLGGAVMIGLYILIIFELVNRTLAAMLAAAASIGALAYLNERPTTEEMVSWLDMDTLILLFSMMVLVAIFCETGFFDYAAYFMFKIANGKVWPLITGLCFFTAIVSAFLDNVTTILLMTPVTIRICEAMELNPVPILISLVIFSNMGGAITPVGDPPNVIIANNIAVMRSGIDFAIFSMHMALGIIPVLIVAYIQLRIKFRSMNSLKFSEPYAVAELRREIDVWMRAADSLSSYSKDECHVRALLLSKVLNLQNKLRVLKKSGGQSVETYKANLAELEISCKIRDWTLLVKCGIVLTTVIVLFFLHSIPQLNLSLGWTALLGTVLLLILADRRELEGIFNRVEWSTLIFFSALFVVMEGVSRLGLLEWIGNQTETLIAGVNEDSRLTVAILLILWVSGIASAFIDNIPFTTMMIQIVTKISENLSLPLQPLIWALALGTCLGGNGTLIGASANVVCAGVADQHGYRFTFMEYFKIGFPMMIVSLIVSTLYLLVCHTLLGWNT